MNDSIRDINSTLVLLRPSEVAQQLKISRAMAYKLLAQGELPAVRIGRIVRVRQADLDAYVQKRWTGWK